MSRLYRMRLFGIEFEMWMEWGAWAARVGYVCDIIAMKETSSSPASVLYKWKNVEQC